MQESVFFNLSQILVDKPICALDSQNSAYIQSDKVGQNSSNGTTGILVSDGDRECSSMLASDVTFSQIDRYQQEHVSCLIVIETALECFISDRDSPLRQNMPIWNYLANLQSELKLSTFHETFKILIGCYDQLHDIPLSDDCGLPAVSLVRLQLHYILRPQLENI